MKKFKWRPILLILFLFTIFLSLTLWFAAKRSPFRSFCDTIFIEKIKDDTLGLHFTLAYPGKLGIETKKVSLPLYNRDNALASYQKIKENHLENDVIFTGWVKTSEFLKKIGYVLSLSDLVESFHIAPFEGMASNGIGMALKWEGIEYIYPQYTIYSSEKEIIQKIDEYNHNEELRKEDIKKSRDFVIKNYNLPVIWKTIYRVLENE